MQIVVYDRIDDVQAKEWNHLVKDDNPFLKHEFLAALEHHDCVGTRFGWLPCHITAWDEGHLVGATPLYIKHNSYGEFVFDHSWANAYRREGFEYYPKLVCAIPYTPVTGQRLLVDTSVDIRAVQQLMVERMLDLAQESGLSSVHWLFTREEGVLLKSLGMYERLGVQFHWHNQGYTDFEQFLSELMAKRRKNIRQERRKVRDAGIRLRMIPGYEVTQGEWFIFDQFYRKTFEERLSLPTLNQGFFQEVGQTMGNQVILVLAYESKQCIAGALLYRSRHKLYGRHWGARHHFDSLHFETCYYQGIEYVIEQGLSVFESGAQGEHKIWRGFMPTLTYSYHWIDHPAFRKGVKQFLSHEKLAIEEYFRSLLVNSPFKKE
jgi:predicted N-acyltransferase